MWKRGGREGEGMGVGAFVCACVGREGCPCWLFKAPPLFMFGNLRNGLKEEEKERAGGWRQAEEEGSPSLCGLSMT